MANVIEMYSSLVEACDLAGGTPPNVQRLRTMTVMELIELLAPNGIRFRFIKKNRDGS